MHYYSCSPFFGVGIGRVANQLGSRCAGNVVCARVCGLILLLQEKKSGDVGGVVLLLLVFDLFQPKEIFDCNEEMAMENAWTAVSGYWKSIVKECRPWIRPNCNMILS